MKDLGEEMMPKSTVKSGPLRGGKEEGGSVGKGKETSSFTETQAVELLEL